MQVYPSRPVVFDHGIGIAFSLALLWLLIGCGYRMVIWLRARSDLSLALGSAPRNRFGVVTRLFLELFIFRSLWRGDRITWAASIAFHYGLLLVLLMHLRFVINPLPLWLVPIIGISLWGSLAMLIGLSLLLIRRVLVDRIRYISSPSDYLHLLMLLAIAVSGLILKRVWPTDLYQVGEFLRGSIHFSWQPLPGHGGLITHLVLVLVLLLVFPISKLMHGIGIAFAPTFVQRDRHRGKG